MEALARALLRRPVAIAVVVISLLVTGTCAFFARNVEPNDDILAFLPATNPEVARFYDINRRFGGLDIALVGIETDQLFAAETLQQIHNATEALNELKSVSYALSISNLEDPVDDPVEGLRLQTLVDAIPSSPEEEAALREKIMAQEHVVGTLVSAEGNAAMIYCFLGADVDPRTTAETIRAVVDSQIPETPQHEVRKYWGGAPFVSTWIFDTTQKDMDRLTPWAVLAVILILLITFRDFRGTFLALLSTSMGIAVAHGLMAVLGVEYNIVLSSMPIILFAVGSAYSIHILSRYYVQEEQHGRDEALRLTLVGVGPTVIAAGLTTVAGLLSFLAMDIEPMRNFGLFTAIGIFTTLLLSVTFVPAVIRLAGPKRRIGGWSAAPLMVAVARMASDKKIIVGPVLIVLALAAVGFVTQVKARMDTAAFFDEDSPPAQADSFLTRHFGGSQFIQILFEGNLKSPHVLREMQYIGDRLSKLEHVTGAIHIAGPIAQANEAFEGLRRIPDQEAKVGALLGFMTGNRAVAQVISDDRSEALIQLKIGSSRAEEVEAVLAKVEDFVATQAAGSYSIRPAPQRVRERVATRIRALNHLHGLAHDSPDLEEVIGRLKTTVDSAVVQAELVTFMGSEEFLATLPNEPNGAEDRLASALVALGPDATEEELAAAAAAELSVALDDELILDILFSVGTPLLEIWSRQAALARAEELQSSLGWSSPANASGDRYRLALASALVDLESEEALVPDPEGSEKIDLTVSGLPV
ncbi:MAG: MMPL family transporter, partial [Myxococcota bacterium]|nr:MMPL family transporter [Myxococcota bacterium]